AHGGRAVLTSATGPSLQNAHFGPILLSDCTEPGRWGDIGDVKWPVSIWFFATLLSFASLAIIAAASENTVSDWLHDPRDRRTASAAGLWAAGVGAALVLLATMGFSFDRYWLATTGPLVGWAAVRIGATNDRPNRHGIGIGWALVSLAALF